jgi:SAM-dependent methyltransferase
MDPSFYASYYRHEDRHWWFRWRFELITRLVSEQKKGPDFRILDAGCGTGQMLKHLEELGDAIGIDTSAQATAFAQSRGVKKLVQGSITEVPFPEATFDCIVALDVIEHVEDDFGILQSLHEVLKPGGRLIITVPAYEILWSEHDEINHHKRRYTAPKLQNLIEAAGYSVDRVTYCNTVFFLPIFAIRKFKNLMRKARNSNGAHPDGLQSDLGDYPELMNEAAFRVMQMENGLMRHVNLPFGVSILAVAERVAPVAERVVPSEEQVDRVVEQPVEAAKPYSNGTANDMIYVPLGDEVELGTSYK